MDRWCDVPSSLKNMNNSLDLFNVKEKNTQAALNTDAQKRPSFLMP